MVSGSGSRICWPCVSSQADRFFNNRITANLDQGRDRAARAENERLEQLRLAARLVASFPQLKAPLAETDTATMRDFLLAYQQENKSRALLIALDPSGRIVARADTPEPVPLPDTEAHWFGPRSIISQPAG